MYRYLKMALVDPSGRRNVSELATRNMWKLVAFHISKTRSKSAKLRNRAPALISVSDENTGLLGDVNRDADCSTALIGDTMLEAAEGAC